LSEGKEARYRVIFLGPSHNDIASLNKLAQGLKSRFKLSDETVSRVMKIGSVAIKEEVSLSEAQRYKEALESIGAGVKLELIDVESARGEREKVQQADEDPAFLDREPHVIPMKANEFSPSSERVVHEANVGQQTVKCPQCGFEQGATDECSRCGVVISKFQKNQMRVNPADVKKVAPSDAEIPAGPQASKIIRNPVLLFILILVLLASLSVWAYYGPHRTLNKIREAAEKGDTEALRDLIDFPSVRESLKEQLNSIMAKKMTVELKDNPFASLGMMIASAIVDKMVDSFVTPNGIASLVKGMKPKFDPSQNPNENIDSSEEKNTENKISKKYRYEGLSKFIVSFCNKDKNTECISLILRRDGLKWKLTEIQIPEMD
jgi:hypothetical protein